MAGNKYAMKAYANAMDATGDYTDYGTPYTSTIGPYGGMSNYVLPQTPVTLSKTGGMSLSSEKTTDAQSMGLSLADNDPTYGIQDYSPSSGGGSNAAMGGLMGYMATGNPYVLAATVGLGYLQQKAADARAKREREAQIIQSQAGNEINILNNLSNQYGRALLR